MTLEISTESLQVLPIEPIPFTVSIFNNTNGFIRGVPVILPNAGYIKIFIAVGEGPFELFRTADWPLANVLPPKKEPKPLKPGYNRQVNGFLYFARRAVYPGSDPKDFVKQHLLGEPGVYRIKTVLTDRLSKKTIESNILTIKVTQPVGQDALAYEFLKSQRSPYFLLRTFGSGSSKQQQKVITEQENFLSQFPDSRYARYVKYSLGNTYTNKGNDYLDVAITLLEEAAGYKDFFLAEKALGRLVDVSLKQEKLDKAQHYNNILKKRFPDSPEAKVAASMIGKVLSGTKKYEIETQPGRQAH